jgi:hypothetical protein
LSGRTALSFNRSTASGFACSVSMAPSSKIALKYSLPRELPARAAVKRKPRGQGAGQWSTSGGCAKVR